MMIARPDQLNEQDAVLWRSPTHVVFHSCAQVAAVMPHVSAFIEFNSQRLVGVLTLV